MNRNTGLWGTIAIVVVTMFGFSVRPGSRGTSPAAEPGQTARAVTGGTTLQPSLDNLEAPCRQINNRIAEFVSSGVKAPESCKEDPAKPAGTLRSAKLLQTSNVRYIIATLPDPVHTHFSLLFDRLTEALQQAAQEQGYNYDDSWLPWNEESPSGDQKADTLQRRQNQQPGVLVFRSAVPPASAWPPCPDDPQKLCVPAPYSQGLIVFVVGENPTGGIHLGQFQNAIQWVQALSPQGRWENARILGPYFSGSFPSLAQALLINGLIKGNEPPLKPSRTAQGHVGQPVQGTKVTNSVPAASAGMKNEANAGQEPGSLTVFSGSASSKAGIDWFTKFLENSSGRFYSFQENDDLMIDRYCQYLTNLGYDTGKLAIISENETAYGVFPPTLAAKDQNAPQQRSNVASAQWLPHCDNPIEQESGAGKSPAALHGPLYLYYPRDIAALRSAYQQQPSGGSSSSGTGMGLPIDLGESSGRQRDTIRNFGGKQTPLSQEATLFGITNLFKAHDIQFIILRSSNSLDQVFLTQFLSRAYPQARVTLTSADLLFRRSSETSGFRGTQTLTTYPLLTWQQDWTYWHWPESRHSHRAFPEDFAEGLYLATRFLIDGTKAPDQNGLLSLQNSSVVVQDFAPPFWLLPRRIPEHTGTRPPTWVSVIGNEQLSPVAVLDESTLAGQKGTKDSDRILCGQGQAPESTTLPCIATGAQYHAADLPRPLPMFVCGAIILVWCCWHFFSCVLGSHDSSIRLPWLSFSIPSSHSLAYFAPVPRPQHNLLIFIGCTVMGLMAILIAAMTGVLTFPLHPPLEHPNRAIAYCAVLFVLSWAALIGNYRTLLPAEWKKQPSPVGEDAQPTFVDTRQEEKGTGDASRSAAVPERLDLHRMLVGGMLFLGGGVLLVSIFHHCLVEPLGRANSVFAIWRSLNLFTGVSPLVPLLLLNAGLYGWFWYSLSGLALFNADRFKLPPRMLLDDKPMLVREEAGRRIERAAIPLNLHYGLCFLSFLVPYVVLWWLSGQAGEIQSLGPIQYGRLYFVWLGLLIVLMLTEAWLMLRTWGRLRHLLIALDHLPLRNTMLALKVLSWGTVWKMSGNVIEQRHLLIARQKESLQHLQHETARFPEKPLQPAARRSDDEAEKASSGTDVAPVGQQLKVCDESLTKSDDWFALHYPRKTKDQPPESRTEAAKSKSTPRPKAKSHLDLHPGDLAPLRKFQNELATTAGVVFVGILKPGWEILGRSPVVNLSGSADGASHDKPVTEPLERLVRAGEELFCLLYIGFIQNILGRIRTMSFSIMILFIAATLSLACYPFDPRPLLGGTFLALFVVIAAIMIIVFAQAHRDPTLNYITNTDPGKLGQDFWIKLIAFGIGPLIGLLTALFPEVSSFLTSWLQPGVQAIK